MKYEKYSTPGPWIMIPFTNNGIPGYYLASERNKKKHTICVPCHDSQEAIANALLLKAAPELMEAAFYTLGHLTADEKYHKDEVLWSCITHFLHALSIAGVNFIHAISDGEEAPQ